MMHDRATNSRPLPNYHVHHQQMPFNRFKHLNNINVTATLNRQQQNQSSSADSNHVQITNFIKLTEKNFPIKRYQTNFTEINLTSDNSQRTVSHEYNPFADENESFARFQLSKSVNNESPHSTQSSTPRARVFGNDRTNFVQQTERHYPSNSGKPATFTRTEHRASSSNVMALKSSMDVDTMSSNSNDENTVMFRNYDLNDEYWLNFEWFWMNYALSERKLNELNRLRSNENSICVGSQSIPVNSCVFVSFFRVYCIPWSNWIRIYGSMMVGTDFVVEFYFQVVVLLSEWMILYCISCCKSIGWCVAWMMGKYGWC